VRRLLIATVATFGLGQVAIPIEVVFATTTLHAGDSGYGLLLTSWGVGMVAGAAVFALARYVGTMLFLAGGVALIAIGYGGLAVSPTLAVACVMSFVGGSGNGSSWVAARTTLQQQIPIRNQSAVGFMAGGVLATVGSPRTAYAVSAIGVALVLLTFLIRPINRVYLKPVLEGSGKDQIEPIQDGNATTRAPLMAPQDFDTRNQTTSRTPFGIG